MAKENNQSDVLGEIEKRLLGSAGSVSSEDSAITSAINSAIGSTQQAGNAAASRINTDFSSERKFLTGQGEAQMTTSLEGRSGYGTQLAAMRMMTETTDKTLRDLDQRKNDALMANDSATATRISDLQIKELEARQTAKQQLFQNLMSISNFSLAKKGQETQVQQEAARMKLAERAQDYTETQGERNFTLAERAQDFGESQAMGEIALEFGLSIGETDDINSVITRAQATGIVNEKRQLELESIRADIAAARATTARAVKGLEMDSKTFSETERLALAQAYREGKIDLSSFNNTEMAAVLQASISLSDEATTKMNDIANSKKFNSIEAFQEELDKNGIYATQDEVNRAFLLKQDVQAKKTATDKSQRSASALMKLGVIKSDDKIY